MLRVSGLQILFVQRKRRKIRIVLNEYLWVKTHIDSLLTNKMIFLIHRMYLAVLIGESQYNFQKTAEWLTVAPVGWSSMDWFDAPKHARSSARKISPFRHLLSLSTFETLFILGRCFPCSHSLVISLYVPQSVPVLLSLGIFTSLWWNRLVP